MKVVGLVVGLLLVTGLAFADVTAEIISKDLDDNGNIRVWTQFKQDGVEVPSRYPKIDGKYVYCTRYSKQNFKDMEIKDVENYILNDIKNYDEGLIQKEFDKKAPKTIHQIRIDYNTTANQAFSDTLDKLVGKTISATEKSCKIDTDNDGTLDKEVIIKQDGSKVEKSIVNP